MRQAKITTYVLMVSTQFPAYHTRKGEDTFFPEQIIEKKKIHTIRTNFSFWEKRIKTIQEGKAILSIRKWLLPGGCYKKGNKQIEICQLDKNSGIGYQKVKWDLSGFYIDEKPLPKIKLFDIAENDGLNLPDFSYWFQNCPEELMIMIHFTNFRYE